MAADCPQGSVAVGGASVVGSPILPIPSNNLALQQSHPSGPAGAPDGWFAMGREVTATQGNWLAQGVRDLRRNRSVTRAVLAGRPGGEPSCATRVEEAAAPV
jgi:hypothetical protein